MSYSTASKSSWVVWDGLLAMQADLCVSALHKIDSDITQQEAEEQARAPRGVHEPLLPKETGGSNGIFVRRPPTGKRPSQHANPDYIV